MSASVAACRSVDATLAGGPESGQVAHRHAAGRRL